jgi:FkbM family methyltransferase
MSGHGEETLRHCAIRGLDVLLGVQDHIEQFRADTYASKEPETLDWIDRYFRPGDCLYDIGANIGLYSLYAAKRLGGDCRVLAFEPEAANHARLVANIRHNGLAGVVLPHCLALTDRLTLQPFYLNPWTWDHLAEGRMAPGSSGHRLGQPSDFAGAPFTAPMIQGMLGVSVDFLCDRLGAPRPNHVKIDTDGNELDVLAGMAGLLARPSLRSVLVEASPGEGMRRQVMERLVAAGFVNVDDFAEHSRDQLRGSPWEGTENLVFLRQ